MTAELIRSCSAGWAAWALAALMLAGAGAASAADDAGLPLWEVGFGAGALSLPHYRGSDQSHQWLLPVPYVVYRGRLLRADRDGARAVLLSGERVEFDLSVSASAPARSRDNRARSGMQDLAPTLEAGPNLKMRLAEGAGWQLDLRLPVHAVFTVNRDARSIGWTAQPALNLDRQFGGWNLGLQGGPLFGSRAYHGYFYGVSPSDATADRPAYSARGGFAGWRLTAAASHRFGPYWLGAFVRADSLQGAVFEDSPLVRRRQHLSAGLALSRVFGVSNERVAVQP